VLEASFGVSTGPDITVVRAMSPKDVAKYGADNGEQQPHRKTDKVY
jgi:hypothetical protein